MVYHTSHKSHTKIRLLGLFFTCAIFVLALLFGNNPLGGKSQFIQLSPMIAHADDSEPSTSEPDDDADGDDADDGDDAEASDEEPEDNDVSDAKNELGEFTKISQDFASDDLEDMLENKSEVPGNLWSGLGGTGKYFAVFTKATKTVNYDDLAAEDKRLGAAGTFGYVLDRTGLDHSFAANTTNEIMARFGRIVFGALAIAGYALQFGINYMFGLVVKLADYVNIFGWLTNSMTINYGEDGTMQNVNFGSKVVELDPNSPFASLRESVVSIYTGFAGLGITLAVVALGVSIGLAVLGWKVSDSKRTTTGAGILNALGKFVFRLVIILATPILVGTLFTSILDKTKDAYTGVTVSDYAIYSNMIDFKKWVIHSRLALPNGKITDMIYTTDDGKIAPVSHDTILKINTYGAGLRNAKATLALYDSSANKAEMQYGKSVEGDFDDAKLAQEEEGADDWGVAILNRWMALTEFEPATYEAYAKMDYYNKVLNKDSDAIDKDEFIEAITTDGTLSIEGGYDATKYRNGTYITGQPIAQHDSKSSDAMIGTASGGTRDGVTASPAGLSTLGMFNYLTTVFTPTNMKYTDANSLVSTVSAPYHSAVGLSGRGFVAFGNVMLMLSMIWSMAIIGFMFAMYAFNALITSIPKIIANLAASTLGSPMYFIKLLMAVIIVGIELLGGAVLYTLSQRLLIGIAQMGDSMLGSVVAGTSVGIISSSASTTVYGFVNVLIAGLLFYVAIMMIKLRGKILGMFGTMLEGTLNKIFRMFETTNQGSNSFQNGQNGLYTTDEQGNNQFTNIDGSKNAHSDKLHGWMGDSGTGTGSDTKGSRERGSKVQGAKSLLGKGYNAMSEIDDRIKAEEGRLGRELTSTEKAGIIAKESAVRAGLGAMTGASAVLGSNKGGDLAHDIDAIRDAKVEDGLRKAQEQREANQQLQQGVADGSYGTPQDVQDVENFRKAQEQGGVSPSAQSASADGTNGAVMLGKNTTGQDGTGAKNEQNINARQEATTTAKVDAHSDITASQLGAKQGDAAAMQNIPAFNSQQQGAMAIMDAKQKVNEAEFALRNAPASEQQARELAVREAKEQLQRVEQGVAAFAQQPSSSAIQASNVTPIPAIKSAEQGAFLVANAEKVADKAQGAYNQAVLAQQNGSPVSPAKIEQLKTSAVDAQQKLVATQQGVAAFTQAQAVQQPTQTVGAVQTTNATTVGGATQASTQTSNVQSPVNVTQQGGSTVQTVGATNVTQGGASTVQTGGTTQVTQGATNVTQSSNAVNPTNVASHVTQQGGTVSQSGGGVMGVVGAATQQHNTQHVTQQGSQHTQHVNNQTGGVTQNVNAVNGSNTHNNIASHVSQSNTSSSTSHVNGGGANSNVHVNNASSTSIPTFTSVSQANHTVTQALGALKQAEALHANAPAGKREVYERQVQTAKHTLKMAQSGASAMFNRQPAPPTIARPVNGQAISNQQAGQHLRQLAKAHTTVAQMTNGSNGKVDSQALRQARSMLRQTERTALQAGMRKEVVSSPSNIKKSMDALNTQHQTAINGLRSDISDTNNRLQSTDQRTNEVMTAQRMAQSQAFKFKN